MRMRLAKLGLIQNRLRINFYVRFQQQSRHAGLLGHDSIPLDNLAGMSVIITGRSGLASFFFYTQLEGN